ncbi:MAG: transglutaminase-like domain-containing protein [Deltaproteobacteria bacterium]
MKPFLQFTILTFVILLAGSGRTAEHAKEHFLSLAAPIDAATADAMAANLTRADWYEVDSAFLLDAFQATLEARRRFAWGRQIPDDIYRRYVVPLRVSREPLQPFRRKFLDEIGSRLEGIQSLARAALEVNLYLGERIGFRSTDRQDQGPLTTLSCGFGRCEEEVIVAIDAMRSVGIPARAIWVPYWSATDNNHVWLEVYTEDGWKFMDAAAPATRLNKAWFDKALQRAPILLTMGTGYEANAKDVVKTVSGYRLNVTRNYLTPARLIVEMPKNWGKKDRLWFALFNFGTIRPLVELIPRNGSASLDIGNGDFVLMGIHGGKLFFQTFTARLHQTTHVRLDVSRQVPRDFTLTYPWPPATGKQEPELLAPQSIEKAHVLKKERDVKRSRTVAAIERVLRESGNYSKELEHTLQRCLGNEKTVLDAVLAMPLRQRDNAIFVVSRLRDKVLRGVNAKVLRRWLRRTPPGPYAADPAFKELVLDPQVDFEYPGTGLPAGYATAPLQSGSPAGLRQAAARYAALVDTSLPQRLLPPVTIDHMLANGVAVSAGNAAIWWTDRLRRSGIPARREPLSDWLEFYHDGKWLPLFPGRPDKLGDRQALPEVRGHYLEPATVRLHWKKGAAAPRWKLDFLFLPIRDTMPAYRRDRPKAIGTEGNTTELKLEAGKYLMTAGRRNGRGDVAVQVRIIELAAGKTRTMNIDLVPPPEPSAENSGPQQNRRR